uniref:Gypsy retrotransposon integrase-like protein 1 n=1 Tax=Latimeria chalumnae TaxID=7897 RepID=H3AST2_LATCH
NPDNVESITKFPTPTTAKAVRQFLGLTGFYHKFIQGYAKLAEPLVDLTRRDVPFKWTPACQAVFEHFEQQLTTNPILVFPDFNRPFAVHTDACDVGLGGALMQKDDEGNDWVIAYASRTLHQSERHFSATEKECLAVVWCLECFWPYLEGAKFKVFTDHNSLRWLMNRPDPTGRLARWCLRLQEFDFSVIHKPGCHNQVPDTLSRNPLQVPSTDRKELKEQQLADNNLLHLIEQLEAAGNSEGEDNSPYYLIDGVLYYKYTPDFCRLHPSRQFKLYAPSQLHNNLLHHFHDHPLAGHLGIAMTYPRLQQQVYWPGLHKDLKRYVQTCPTCQISKPSQRKLAGKMVPIQATYPW